MSHSAKTISNLNWLDTSLYAFWRGFYDCAKYNGGNKKISMTLVLDRFVDAYKINIDDRGYSMDTLRQRLTNVIYTYDNNNPFNCS